MPRTSTKNLSKYRCWVVASAIINGDVNWEHYPIIISKNLAKKMDATQYKTKEDCQKVCDIKNKKA